MSYNPQKYLKAHDLVGYALRVGRLKRKPCEVCGKRGEAHHDDYTKPYEVRWLCRFHHVHHHLPNKCSKGHEFTIENTYWRAANGGTGRGRRCRKCHNEKEFIRRAQIKDKR